MAVPRTAGIGAEPPTGRWPGLGEVAPLRAFGIRTGAHFPALRQESVGAAFGPRRCGNLVVPPSEERQRVNEGMIDDGPDPGYPMTRLPLKSSYGAGPPGARSAGGGDTQDEAGVRSGAGSSSGII